MPVGDDLAISLTVTPTYFDFGTSYEAVWTSSDETKVTVVGTNAGATVTGVAAGASTIKCEIKKIVGETLVSFNPKVEDTIAIPATSE